MTSIASEGVSVASESHRLGGLLIQRRIINAQQLSAAVDEQHRRQSANPSNAPALGEILIEMGAIDSKQLSRCLKWQTFLRRATLTLAFSLAPFQALQAAPYSDEHNDADYRYEISKQLSMDDPVFDESIQDYDYKRFGFSVPHIGAEQSWASTLIMDHNDVELESAGLHYKADFSIKHISLEVNYTF